MASASATKVPFWTNSLKFWLWVVIIAVGVNTWVAQVKHNVYVSEGNTCATETQEGATDLAVTCYENGIKTLNDYTNWITWTEWIAAIGGIIFLALLADRIKVKTTHQTAQKSATNNLREEQDDELESWEKVKRS